MAWLNEQDLNNWVEIVNDNGHFLGWATIQDCRRLNISLQFIETPKLYLTSPIIRHHAIVAKERGVLAHGNDISEVQNVLLLSNYINAQDEQEKLRVRTFEEMLWITDTEKWKAYQKQKQEQEAVDMGEDVEERIPQDINEFLAALQAFSEEDVEETEEQPTGWLASVLDTDALSEMED